MNARGGSVGCLAAAAFFCGLAMILASVFDGDRQERWSGLALVVGAIAAPFVLARRGA